jgi:hypothetical protein
MAIQPDVKAVVAGVTANPFGFSQDFAVARYDLSGAAPCRTPSISNVTGFGKQLLVKGAGFDEGAVILVNGQEQKTKPDASNPRGSLIAKKGAKKTKSGQLALIQVRNACGKSSIEFSFTK